MPTRYLKVPDITHRFSYELTNAWKVLLETKNLYQSISPDLSEIKENLGDLLNVHSIDVAGQMVVQVLNTEEKVDPDERLKYYLRKFIYSEWVLTTEYSTKSRNDAPVAGVTKAEVLEYRLPTIHINCKHCESILPPHNSGYPAIGGDVPNLKFSLTVTGKGCIQVFSIPYFCQSCKKEPVVFHVRREGIKLTLVGRSHLYVPAISKAVPVEDVKHLRGALIASTTGNLLPALFMLRVFVEQYMRRIAKVSGRIRGEDLADEYARYLPDGFPSSLRSLKSIYEQVSECLHEANESQEIFDKCVNDTIIHFEQLRILPLKKLP